ncbi:glycosyltransferase family 2 protein [Leptospira mayottensis]|uniref:glycosyltransferase family 2 protein n=1 Tax=Leptospira mayottensis TaxID=1137606 RepID=UPI000E35975A|nr:glycosyltransferase family A protein [Leptospira mayottensis]AXR69307.1 glycosyltransferase family 2 protein [Leptospira mayottensis]
MKEFLKDKVYSLPEISVIVCSYNHAKWIERCIRSIVHQEIIDPESYEIIIVNDGSKDHTLEILENLSVLHQVKIINNEINSGLPQSLNKAIRSALGRYVVRVDSDDYVSRKFLSLMRLFLDMNREYQAVAVDYIKVDENENVIERVNCFEDQIACGIMFRKECLFEVGLYDENFQMREGHNLRKRFEEKFKIARLEFPLYKYRHHSKNRTKNFAEVEKYDQLL